MEILLSDYEYQNDMNDVEREFCPATLDDITTIKLEYKLQPTAVEMEIQINSVNGQKHFSKQFDTNNGEGVKSRLKLGLYDALAEYFDKQLPYGCLTGVRPTKVAYSLMNNGLKLSQIPNYFRTNYRVSNEKIKLI